MTTEVRRYKSEGLTAQVGPVSGVLGIVLMAIGLVVLATVPLGLWATTSNLDRLIAALEPVMAGDSPQRFRADIEQVGDSLDELVLGLPLAIAEQEGLTVDEAAALLITEYPVTADGVAELSGRGLTVGTVVSLLEAEQSRYEQISRFPVAGFPARLLPVLAVITGSVLVGSGMALALGRTPIPGACLAAVIVALVVVQSLPERAHDVVDFRAIYIQSLGPEAVEGGRQGLDRLEAFYDDLLSVTLPGLAERLGLDAEQTGQAVADRLPATDSVVGSLPRIRVRYDQLLRSVSQVEDIEDIDPLLGLPEAIDVLFLASILGLIVGTAGEVARRADW